MIHLHSSFISIVKGECKLKCFKYFCVFMVVVMVLRNLYTGGVGDVIMTIIFWWLVYIIPYSFVKFSGWIGRMVVDRKK